MKDSGKAVSNASSRVSESGGIINMDGQDVQDMKIQYFEIDGFKFLNSILFILSIHVNSLPSDLAARLRVGTCSLTLAGLK
jgi:hypothetical protein